jgi:RimJ/RimL family protein N-acetyltransferase
VPPADRIAETVIAAPVMAAVPVMAVVASGGGSRADAHARQRADSEARPGAEPGAGPGAEPGAGPGSGPDAEPAVCSAAASGALAGGVATGEPDARASDLAAVDAFDGHAPRRRALGTAQREAAALQASGTIAVTVAPPRPAAVPRHDDLLDRIAAWGPADTPAGRFHLVPVRIERDLALIGRWMNDPATAEFWELAGPQEVTRDHLRAQLAGDGRSVPCLGLLNGAPMSYWEIYRADLDPLARHYPARPHDTGIHLLLGGVADRGRGLGGLLLRAVADLVLVRRPSCTRVIAEPDIRNTPSIAAFLTAGFRFSAEVDLTAKRAALMIRDRPLQQLL